MFLPCTTAEIERLGWDALDVILVSGDAYIDSPFCGIAVIGRTLLAAGFRTAIIAQPDVASLDDLGRIAARLGAVVLQEARPGYHAFFVNDLEVTYRFEAEGTADEHSTEPKITRRVA